MKYINKYISEKLKISKKTYNLFPKTKEELCKMIEQEIKQNGYECDLNHIDVREITDLSWLFAKDGDKGYGLQNFNGDISEWDVSNVKNMSHMFYQSIFNGDISQWDVSNVIDMNYMFYNSDFNGDISDWDVSNVQLMSRMFQQSKFNQPIGNWDVRKVKDMEYMFKSSNFNKDISKWDVSNVEDMSGMFDAASFNQPIGNWDVSNVKTISGMFAYKSSYSHDLSNWKINPNCNANWVFYDCYISSKHKPFQGGKQID
jgi:surface protein